MIREQKEKDEAKAIKEAEREEKRRVREIERERKRRIKEMEKREKERERERKRREKEVEKTDIPVIFMPKRKFFKEYKKCSGYCPEDSYCIGQFCVCWYTCFLTSQFNRLSLIKFKYSYLNCRTIDCRPVTI